MVGINTLVRRIVQKEQGFEARLVSAVRVSKVEPAYNGPALPVLRYVHVGCEPGIAVHAVPVLTDSQLGPLPVFRGSRSDFSRILLEPETRYSDRIPVPKTVQFYKTFGELFLCEKHRVPSEILKIDDLSRSKGPIRCFYDA